MSDPKRADHWDLLASVLGAEPQKKEPGEPTAQAEEKKPETTEDIKDEDADAQASLAEPLVEPAATSPASPLSKWDALAMELGIEVKPEPPPTAAPIQMYVPKQLEKRTAVRAEQPREPSGPATGEFGKNIEPFGTSETMTVEEAQEQSEKKARHRRRRRHKGRDKDRSSIEEMNKPSIDSQRNAPWKKTRCFPRFLLKGLTNQALRSRKSRRKKNPKNNA